MKTAHKFEVSSFHLLINFMIIFLLLLVCINIKNYLTDVKVLGVETAVPDSKKFWEEYTLEHPTYIPGWIEIGRTGKASEIDPNFVTP